jgi:hypothetical protein
MIRPDKLISGITLLLTALAVFAPGLRAYREIDCSTCHGAISAEWRSSLHAASWTSPVFEKEKETRSLAGPTTCACHAPDNVPAGFLGRAPELRADSLQAGVDCLACHMDRDRVAWSCGDTLYVPHWVRANRIYAEGKFCAGCHGWAEKAGEGCQDCHMPAVAGADADYPGLTPQSGQTHRSHACEGSRNPEMLARGAALETARKGRSLTLSVSNLIPVHAFPQDKRRRAEVLVVPVPGGQAAALWRETLKLAPDSTARFAVDLPGQTAAVRVQLRFYPAPAVWPDSFYLLVDRKVEQGGAGGN